MEPAKTKVFLVSSGCYSDWTIEGICSTRELAEKLRALLPRSADANEVEEWTVDEWADRVRRGVSVWQAWSKDGCAVDVDRVYHYGPDCKESIGSVDWFPGHSDTMRVFVEAADEAHAIKIAADKFREHIAMRTKP